MTMLMAGGQQVFLPRFSAASALAAIAEHRITATIAVPTILMDLADAACARGQASNSISSAPGSPRTQTGSPRTQDKCGGGLLLSGPPFLHMRRLLIGAGELSPAVLRTTRDLFPSATIHSAYGITEGASSLTFRLVATPDGAARDATEPSGLKGRHSGDGGLGGACVGRAAPGIQLAIAAMTDTGSEAGAHVVRGQVRIQTMLRGRRALHSARQSPVHSSGYELYYVVDILAGMCQ